MEINQNFNQYENMKKKIDLVLTNKIDSENWLKGSGYMEEWKSWHDLYRSIPDKKPENWMSNKFYPMTMAKIEAEVANLQGILLAGNPPFEVRPREGADEVQARIIQKLLAYQLDESDFNFEFINFIRSLCIYGTAIGKAIWDIRYKPQVEWQQQFQPITNFLGMQVGVQPMGMVPQEVMKKVCALPKFINCNLADVFPDPTAIDIQDGWVIHRTRRSRDYLLQMHTDYPGMYTDEVLKIEDADAKDENLAAEETQQIMGRQNLPKVKRQPGEGGVELLERWGLAEKDGRLVPWLMTVAAGKYLIVDMPNPYWHKKNPFVKGQFIPVSNEFYGIGIPEMIEDLQTNLNEIVNQRNDNISLALNKPILYKKGAVNPKGFVLKPGIMKGVEEEIDSCMKALEYPIYTRDSFAQTMDIERWAQEVTGVSKITMGATGKDTNDTATGMAIVQRASGERFMAIARQIESKVFKEIIKMFYQLDYQFIEMDEMIRVVGEAGTQWVKVSPDDIRRNYDFAPTGTFSMENKGQKALRLIQFYNIVKGNPMLKETTLLKKIYTNLEIGDSPDELLRPEAEQMEIMKLAQMMAQQMAVEMIQQKGVPVKGKEGVKTPGMNNGQFKGNEMAGTPGVPPVSPGIPPGERI